jgi:hypothetical protein
VVVLPGGAGGAGGEAVRYVLPNLTHVPMYYY